MTFKERLMDLARQTVFHLSALPLDAQARRYRRLLFLGHFYEVQSPEDYRFLNRYGNVHYFRKDGIWLVTGFDEVEKALNNDLIFTTKDVEDFKLFDPTGILIRAERSRHEEVSSIFRDALLSYKQPEYIASFRDRIADIESESEDAVSIDFKKDIAEKLAIRSFGHLIGLTSHDNGLLEEHFDDVDIMNTVQWMDGHLRRTGISEYEAVRDGTIMPALQAAIRKGEITEEEGMDIVKFFLVASTENVSTIFQRIFHILVSDGDLRQRLRKSPQEHAKFIEEVIRLHPPFPWQKRYCVQENDLLGVVIPAGANLLLDVRGANRSAEKFDHPDRLSLEENRHRHLGFGSGLHKCVGMGLARALSRLFLEHYLDRAEGYEIVKMEWLRLNVVNNLKTRTMQVRRTGASVSDAGGVSMKAVEGERPKN